MKNKKRKTKKQVASLGGAPIPSTAYRPEDEDAKPEGNKSPAIRQETSEGEPFSNDLSSPPTGTIARITNWWRKSVSPIQSESMTPRPESLQGGESGPSAGR